MRKCRGDTWWAALTCGVQDLLQCCWQSALPRPGRRWRWYPPWRRGWWTSWWAPASWRTWRRSPCRSWLCHRLLPRLVRKHERRALFKHTDDKTSVQAGSAWIRAPSPRGVSLGPLGAEESSAVDDTAAQRWHTLSKVRWVDKQEFEEEAQS